MRYLALLLFLLLGLPSYSQGDGENPLPVPDDRPASYYVQADVPAEFPGGMSALAQTLRDSMRYPQKEKDNCVQGKINVEFYVDTAGRVIYAQAKDFVPGGPGLQTEAVRLVSSLPAWKPALVNGKKVVQQLTITITFQLMDCVPVQVKSAVYDTATVQEKPEYPGGAVELKKFFKKNIIDPQPATDHQVTIQFTIRIDGSVTDGTVLVPAEGCSMCSIEALRVADLMPKWKPAKMGGKAVDCIYKTIVYF
ncbi:MAG: energy transducer TonB [Bacteroidota bacterium]